MADMDAGRLSIRREARAASTESAMGSCERTPGIVLQTAKMLCGRLATMIRAFADSMSRIASRKVLAPSSEMFSRRAQSMIIPCGWFCRSRFTAALMVSHWFLWSEPDSRTTSSLVSMIMRGTSQGIGCRARGGMLGGSMTMLPCLIQWILFGQGVLGRRAAQILQVVADIGDDHILTTQQGELQAQAGLPMQQVVPPAGRDEFRHDDCHEMIAPLGLYRIQILHDRADQRPVGRVQDNQRHILGPLLPALLELRRLLRVGLDVNGAAVGGERTRILERRHHTAMHARYQHQH